MTTSEAVTDVEAQVQAYRRALGFSPGEEVRVDSPRYHGPGVVSRRTHWDSHVVHLDDRGPHVAVLLENGNVWFYPALDVHPA